MLKTQAPSICLQHQYGIRSLAAYYLFPSADYVSCPIPRRAFT